MRLKALNELLMASGSPDNKNNDFIVVGLSNSTVHVLDHRVPGTLSLASTALLPSIALKSAFSPDGNFLAVNSFGTPGLSLFAHDGLGNLTFSDAYAVSHNSLVNGLSWSPAGDTSPSTFDYEGDYLVSSYSNSPRMTFFGTNIPGSLEYLFDSSQTSNVTFTKHHPFREYFVFAVEGSLTLKMLSLDSNFAIASIGAASVDADFSPDGSALFVVTTSGLLRKYSMPSDFGFGSLQYSVLLPNSARSMAIHPNGKIIAAGYSSTVALYEDTGSSLVATGATYVGPTPYSCNFTSDGKYLVVSGFGGTHDVYLLDCSNFGSFALASAYKNANGAAAFFSSLSPAR